MSIYNLNFPLLQENELLTSYIERVAVLNVLTKDVICKLLKIKSISETNIFDNIEFIKDALGIETTTEELFTKHTLFKLNQLVMDVAEAEETIKSVANGKKSYYLAKAKTYSFKTCPICAKEDVRKHGSPIHYIYHCYPNVKACYKHECNLISIQSFESIEMEKLDSNVIHSNTEDVKFSKFIYELNALNLKPVKEFNKLITTLYNNDWMNNSEFMISEEQVRYADYFHSGCNIEDFSYKERMRALYCLFYQARFIERIYKNYPDNLDFKEDNFRYFLKRKDSNSSK